MDPRTKLALLAAVGICAIVLDRPASLALLAALASAPLLLAPIGWTWRRRALGLALAVTWSTALGQAIFYADVPRTPWLVLGPLTLWREGWAHGLVQSLRLVATTSAGLALATTTTPDRLFAGLAALRVSRGAAFLAVTALRFVPIAASELWTARQARARRGRPIWARSPWAWLRAEMALLVPVAARALRRARSLAEALDSRGFDAASPHAPRHPLRMPGWERALLAVAWAIVAALLGSELLYLAYVGEVLYVPGLRPLYGFVRSWL